MTKGYATSSTRRSSAGVTNTGPRIDSWSSHSRTRPASRGRPRGTGMSSALTAMSAGEDLPHFDLGPGDGVLGRGARHRLGEHVGQQIGVGDELDLVRGRRRPSIGVVLDPLASEGGVLGIRAQYWMVLELVVDWQIERVARHDVLVVDLSLAEQVADPLLGGLDVLREFPDADVARSVGLVAALGAAEAPVVVDAIGGDELPLLCHDVGAHGVVDPARLALLDRLVVARVRPRQHLGLHAVAEHLLVPLDRLGGGRRVDAHGLAVLVHLHAAERPQHGPGGGDRVVVLADGDAHRVPHLLELLAHGVEVFPGVGHLEARLLEEVLAIGRDEHPVVLGHGAPDHVDVSAFVRRADRLPYFFSSSPTTSETSTSWGSYSHGKCMRISTRSWPAWVWTSEAYFACCGPMWEMWSILSLIPVSLVKRWPISDSFLSEAGAKLFQHRYEISRACPHAGGTPEARMPARPVAVVRNCRRLTGCMNSLLLDVESGRNRMPDR